MSNRLSHTKARPRWKAESSAKMRGRTGRRFIGHIPQVKTTKSAQTKANQTALKICAILACIAALNFAVDKIWTAVRLAQSAPVAQMFAPPRDLRIPIDGVASWQLRDTWGEARAQGRTHKGIDIPARQGTPIRAVTAGRIARFVDNDRGGIAIYQIDALNKHVFYYAHLQSRAAGLTEGETVRQGQVLGYVGHTGNASGPHLHFELHRIGSDGNWRSAEPVNPYPYLLSGEAPR